MPAVAFFNAPCAIIAALATLGSLKISERVSFFRRIYIYLELVNLSIAWEEWRRPLATCRLAALQELFPARDSIGTVS
jgi:hypothetical protein